MRIKIGTPLGVQMADFIDHFTPDAMRSGDFYDIMSGRAFAQAIINNHPLLESKDHATIRRLRSDDLTSSGLGFEMMINYGGELHNALVHLPPADHECWSTGKMPVVLDAHGFTDAPRRHTERSGIAEAVVQEGAIGIALGGSRGLTSLPILDPVRSHDGINLQGPLYRDKDGPGLVEFILESVGDMVGDYAKQGRHELPAVEVDRANTIAVGLSNGGALSSWLAASGTVAGAISFSGPTSEGIKALESAETPTAIVFVEGLLDGIVPPSGPTGEPFAAEFITADEAAGVFAAKNGLPDAELSDQNLPPVLASLVQPGVDVQAAGTSMRDLVAIVRIDDHGHAIPGSAPMTKRDTVEKKLGLQTSEKMSGADFVVDFLRAFRS